MKYVAIEKPLLIIGYGNILRRDDGVGWTIARRLARQLPDDRATVMTLPQLLPELADHISRADLVIFIDADAALPPGQISKRPLRLTAPTRRTLGHHESPTGLLRMARDLYHHAPKALLYTIGGADFSFGCTLSASVKIAARTVVQDVLDAVCDCQGSIKSQTVSLAASRLAAH